MYFFTRDAYAICALVGLAGEVCISLVSGGAGVLSQLPRTPRAALKGSPRSVLLPSV